MVGWVVGEVGRGGLEVGESYWETRRRDDMLILVDGVNV